MKSTWRFADRSRDEFAELYYEDIAWDRFMTTKDTEKLEGRWTIDDIESNDAPHVPVPIRYDEVLSDFCNIDEVAGTIVESPDYQSLSNRILNRFRGDKL